MIELIAFDGDDTLWDFDESMRRALRRTLEELWTVQPGPETQQLTVEHLIRTRDRVAEELEGRVVDLGAVRLAAFERTLEEVGIVDSALAARLNAMFFASRRQSRDPFPDVGKVLEVLSASYSLALITNGTSEPAQYGLDRFFPIVVHAHRLGAAKPDRLPFDDVVARTGTSAGAAAYVGDSLTHDIAGAQQAGWRAVWVNRRSVPNTTPIQPDGEITTLGELPGLLSAWET